MTILDRKKHEPEAKTTIKEEKKQDAEQKPDVEQKQADSTASNEESLLTAVESQFQHIMDEFKANSGFSINTGEQPVDTMIELLSSRGVNVSIALLLSCIRHCVNHGLKKEITLKIGFNKPPSLPMNFAVNEEMLEDIYPMDVIEIN